MMGILVIVFVIAMLSGTAYAYAADQHGVNTDTSQEHSHDGAVGMGHTPGHAAPLLTYTWNIKAGQGLDTPHLIAAVEKGFDMWSDLNDNLKFERVNSNADIKITLSTTKDPNLWGLRYIDNRITIYVGHDNCEGMYVERSPQSRTKTMLHEIGHVLGLKHHTDVDHLMWGTHPPPAPNFDARGFNIPARPSGAWTYIGEQELRDLQSAVSETHLGDYLPIQDKIDCFHEPAPDKKPGPDDVAPAPGMVPLEIALGLVNEYGTHQRTMEDRLARLDAGLQSVDKKVDGLEQVANTLKTGLADLQRQFSNLEKAINHLRDRVTSLVNNTPILTEKPVTLNVTAWNDSDGDGIRGIGETAAPNILIITYTPATRQSNLLFTGTDGTVSRDDLPAESFYAIVVPPDGRMATTHSYTLGGSTYAGVLEVENPASGSTYTMNVGIK